MYLLRSSDLKNQYQSLYRSIKIPIMSNHKQNIHMLLKSTITLVPNEEHTHHSRLLKTERHDLYQLTLQTRSLNSFPPLEDSVPPNSLPRDVSYLGPSSTFAARRRWRKNLVVRAGA